MSSASSSACPDSLSDAVQGEQDIQAPGPTPGCVPTCMSASSTATVLQRRPLADSTGTAVNWLTPSPHHSSVAAGQAGRALTPALTVPLADSCEPIVGRRPRISEPATCDRSTALQRKLDGQSASAQKVKAVEERFSWTRAQHVTDARGRGKQVHLHTLTPQQGR